MTKHPIEVITSVERRRRWSGQDKERLVAACLEPEAVLSEIARGAGIHVSQLFRWLKELLFVFSTIGSAFPFRRDPLRTNKDTCTQVTTLDRMGRCEMKKWINSWRTSTTTQGRACAHTCKLCILAYIQEPSHLVHRWHHRRPYGVR